MGSMAVRILAEAGVDVLVLDRDPERGSHLAATVPGVDYRRFDVLEDDLVAVLDGQLPDVVLNTVGPFDTHGLAIMRRSIEAGIDYVDINDDWEPTQQALGLDDLAAEHGVTALIGMGASPGISNVLAREAVERLDAVDTLITGWAIGGTTSEPGAAQPSAAMVHLVHQSTGTVRVVHRGEFVDVPPLQRLEIDYPGIATVPVRLVGHPEPITLHRAFEGLGTCINVMAGPEWWFEGLRERMALVDDGTVTETAAAIDLEVNPISRPGDALRTVHTPGIWALASGTLDGHDRVVAVGLQRRPEGNMAGITAIPTAVAARLIASGVIDRPGVVTPEEVLDVDTLMPELEPYFTLPSPDGPLFEVVDAGGRVEVMLQ